MVLITIQKFFTIQMLIGQDPILIEDLHLGIVSPLVVTLQQNSIFVREHSLANPLS